MKRSSVNKCAQHAGFAPFPHENFEMSGFQKLPRELRDKIYECSLPNKIILPYGTSRNLQTYTRPRWLPALLHTSKQQYEEGVRALLQKTTIRVPSNKALDHFIVFVISWDAVMVDIERMDTERAQLVRRVVAHGRQRVPRYNEDFDLFP